RINEMALRLGLLGQNLAGQNSDQPFLQKRTERAEKLGESVQLETVEERQQIEARNKAMAAAGKTTEDMSRAALAEMQANLDKRIARFNEKFRPRLLSAELAGQVTTSLPTNGTIQVKVADPIATVLGAGPATNIFAFALETDRVPVVGEIMRI